MSECVETTATSFFRGGYGVAPRGAGDGSRRAHRVAWFEANGPIPDGMEVCHSCDNPPCENVDHLFLGTHRENMHDAIQKGRIVKSKHGGAMMYERGCRCTVCVGHNRKRHRESYRLRMGASAGR